MKLFKWKFKNITGYSVLTEDAKTKIMELESIYISDGDYDHEITPKKIEWKEVPTSEDTCRVITDHGLSNGPDLLSGTAYMGGIANAYVSEIVAQ